MINLLHSKVTSQKELENHRVDYDMDNDEDGSSVERMQGSSVEKKLIKTRLEDLGADSDKDYDKEGSAVEKMMGKIEP